ncbi:putative dehydrogenase [Paenibacillus sp. JGP012]|uniref:Gfo/Idh/MocA family protein n=1 Tax=Paenibacillus sp. JGP012 TaxID=2735914 RepID=UPI00161C320E|nr:Gfo/Idh/MocA family oxidoreductase [Paenibacillus sp. JGP012]MBB6022761.1 putative dehydrogenase [Paenibacillus sp. JGP012]
MKKLRVAIIGCGSIAKKRHAYEYVSNSNVEIVAFCDIKIERAEQLVKLHGGKAYSDYRELLQLEKPDVVSVCTPTIHHAPISISAAEAGAHILCEKPMTVSLEDATKMIESAEKNNVMLMIAQNQRYMPSHIRAKELLREGKLGKVLAFRSTFANKGPEYWSVDGENSWFFRKEDSKFGVIGDLGVHKIDLIRWLLDDEVIEIASFVKNIHKKWTELDDNATCILHMKNGAIGNITVSWTYHLEENTTEIWCENGMIKMGDNPDEYTIVEYQNGRVEKYLSETNSLVARTRHNSGVINAFVDHILTKTKPMVSGEEGLQTLKVVLSAVESQNTKKYVNL